MEHYYSSGWLIVSSVIVVSILYLSTPVYSAFVSRSQMQIEAPTWQ